MNRLKSIEVIINLKWRSYVVILSKKIMYVCYQIKKLFKFVQKILSN